MYISFDMKMLAPGTDTAAKPAVGENKNLNFGEDPM